MTRALILSAACLALPLASSAYASAPFVQGDNFSVSVSTDAALSVPFPVVGVGQFGLAQQLTGDIEGNTEAIPIALYSPTVVRLEEVPLTTRGGLFQATSIGQHFTFIPNATEYADGRRLHYFQPVARLINFYAPYGVSDFESGWSASGQTAATYGFQAYTAELPTREVISNYLAFKIGFHVELFQHGLLLRCSQWVDLGTLGITFRINREGYAYGSDGPQVHAYSLGNPGLVSYAQPVVKSIDSTNVEVLLTGYLAPGDNLILFEDPNPGGVFPADPLGDIVSTSTSSGGTCDIPLPTCEVGDTCAPPIPTGAVMGLQTTCTGWHVKIGNPVKAACGTSISQQECTSFKGGVSFGATIGIFSVTISGEVGGSACTTVSVSGGYRAQAWQCFTVCCRDWECQYIPWYSIFPADYMDSTCCVIEGQIETTSCKFSDCD